MKVLWYLPAVLSGILAVLVARLLVRSYLPDSSGPPIPQLILFALAVVLAFVPTRMDRRASRGSAVRAGAQKGFRGPGAELWRSSLPLAVRLPLVIAIYTGLAVVLSVVLSAESKELEMHRPPSGICDGSTAYLTDAQCARRALLIDRAVQGLTLTIATSTFSAVLLPRPTRPDVDESQLMDPIS